MTCTLTSKSPGDHFVEKNAVIRCALPIRVNAGDRQHVIAADTCVHERHRTRRRAGARGVGDFSSAKVNAVPNRSHDAVGEIIDGRAEVIRISYLRRRQQNRAGKQQSDQKWFQNS